MESQTLAAELSFEGKVTKYNYLSGLLQYLLQQASFADQSLKKIPINSKLLDHISKRAQLTAMLSDIDNDLSIIQPTIRKLQLEINEEIESETGGRFKFLIQRKAEMKLN